MSKSPAEDLIEGLVTKSSVRGKDMKQKLKTALLSLSVFAALGTLATEASAVDSEEIKVGISIKNYQYTEDDANVGNKLANNNGSSKTTGNTTYLGLTARYKDFFVLFNPAVSKVNNYSSTLTNSTGARQSFTFNRTRNENDVGFGYFVTPNVSVNAGIKTLQYDTDRGSANGFANSSSCQKKYTIPMVGLSGGYSFQNDWFVFGAANIGINGSVVDNCNWYVATGVQVSNYTGKPNYQNFEGGLGYNINKHFTATLGYRSLQLKQDLSVPVGGGNATAKIYGVGAGIIYNF